MKRLLIFVLMFVMVYSSVVWGNDDLQYDNISDLGLTAKSAILIDQDTGTILYEQNSHEILPPASITKIMTLLLIYEAVQSGEIAWTDTVTVSEHAASMGGSQVYLEEGEQQTVSELTKCIAIASANDAAVAMAECIAGSEEAFVQRMNERAKELHMNETTFVNACGLDVDGHVTSAYDIAQMSRALMQNFPEVQQYTTTWQDTITHHTNRGSEEFGLTNTNKLIQWYEGATGLKTGSTSAALYCLSATAEREGLRLIAVILGAPDHSQRFQQAMKLLDYGFDNYVIETGHNKGFVAGTVTITKGMLPEVEAITANEISILSQKNDTTDWETTVEILPQLEAPVAIGTKVGEMVYHKNGTEVARVDIVTASTVEKIQLEEMFRRLLHYW